MRNNDIWGIRNNNSNNNKLANYTGFSIIEITYAERICICTRRWTVLSLYFIWLFLLSSADAVYCLALCAVTAMTSKGKGHPTKCSPYQLRIVLSLQIAIRVEFEVKRSIFCIAQTNVPLIFCQLFIQFISIVLLIMRLSFSIQADFFLSIFHSKGNLSLTKIFKQSQFSFAFECKCYRKICVNIGTI